MLENEIQRKRCLYLDLGLREICTRRQKKFLSRKQEIVTVLKSMRFAFRDCDRCRRANRSLHVLSVRVTQITLISQIVVVVE